MAHYDCSHCGYSMGIDYGSCERCTPLWVKAAERTYNSARYDVKKTVQKEFKEELAAIQKRIDDRESDLLSGFQADYDLTYAAGESWYKNKKEVT